MAIVRRGQYEGIIVNAAMRVERSEEKLRALCECEGENLMTCFLWVVYYQRGMHRRNIVDESG